MLCLYPTCEAKIDYTLEYFVKVSDDCPPDYAMKVVGLGNQKFTLSFEWQRQHLLDRVEEQNDQDIKRELRKGITV